MFMGRCQATRQGFSIAVPNSAQRNERGNVRPPNAHGRAARQVHIPDKLRPLRSRGIQKGTGWSYRPCGHGSILTKAIDQRAKGRSFVVTDESATHPGSIFSIHDFGRFVNMRRLQNPVYFPSIPPRRFLAVPVFVLWMGIDTNWYQFVSVKVNLCHFASVPSFSACTAATVLRNLCDETRWASRYKQA